MSFPSRPLLSLSDLQRPQQQLQPQQQTQQQLPTFFLINTLYLYSRQTNQLLSTKPRENMANFVNMDCIYSIQQIFKLATEQMKCDTDTTLSKSQKNKLNGKIQDKMGQEASQLHKNKGIFVDVFGRFISSFSRVGTNLFINQNFQNTISLWSFENLNNLGIKDKTSLFRTPTELFERLTGPDTHQIIQLTFDYVIFLFSVALTQNYKYDWSTKDSNDIADLYRHNAMIVSFLSIFIAYFKPLLDDLQAMSPQNDEYQKIINFINQVIKLHNIGNSDNLLNESSTYNRNLNKYSNKSKERKEELGLNSEKPKLSYEILTEYNKQLIEYPNINYQQLYDNCMAGENNLPGELLTSSTGVNLNELIVPMLPDEAKTQPVLSKKMGLSQPEINSLLMDLFPDMCKSNLDLTTVKNQFTISGIPFDTKHPTLKNYLGYVIFTYGTDGKVESATEFLDTDTSATKKFMVLEYFKHLMTAYSQAIEKFYILTAINTHNDIIYMTKVGSFDCEIPTDTITNNIIKCSKDFAIILGSHVVGNVPTRFNLRYKQIVELQKAHRTMIIVDLRPTRNNNSGKVYYFEPFGQFYPVYDIMGRVIPHMPEMVISRRFKEALPEAPPKQFKMVLPLFTDPVGPLAQTPTAHNNNIKACNTSIFSLVNTNYLGASRAIKGADDINTLINSVSLADKNKTLDWTSGYCGLIVLFMTMLIKMNCTDIGGAKRNVDDIFLWFNQFNQEPLFTYNNLLSRFLVRGFANLVENLLAGKVRVIQPVVLNLQNIGGEFYSAISPQFSSYNITKKKLESGYTEETYSQIYELLGLKTTESISSGTEDETNNKATQIKQKLDTIAVFLYSLIENYGKAVYNPVVGAIDESGNSIEIDEKILHKLESHRIKLDPELTKKTKTYASQDAARVFGLAISNKFRKVFGKTDKIKFIIEPSLQIFSGKSDSFNPNFGRIIFVNSGALTLRSTTPQNSPTQSEMQRQLNELRTL